MATEQTITISGTSTVVSGVTVPYANTSDLEIYISKKKIESIEIADSGAGYSNRARNAAEKLIFSGGGGTAPNLWITVGQDANNSGRIDGAIYGHATEGDALDNTNLDVGSDYVTSPNVSLTNLEGGEGAQLTASIYAKKASGTDYTLSGTSGNTTITFGAGLLENGNKVLIKRATGVSTAANTFAAGSAITAEALNKSFDQIRYKVEELPNVTSTAVTNGVKEDIKVQGNDWTIEDNAVTSGKIANAQVIRSKIAGDAIDGTKIDDESIDSEHYANLSIDTAHIANSQVTFAKIQNIAPDKVLGRTDTGDGVVSAIQVDTEMIANDAVTYTKMQNTSTANRVLGAVSAGAIGETEVEQDMLKNEAVNEAKLQISNSPTDGKFLQYKDDTDELTWADPFNAAGAGPTIVHQSVAADIIGGFDGTEIALTINITPQRTASKVLILFSGIHKGNSENSTKHIFKLYKGVNQIGETMQAAGSSLEYPTQIILDSPNTNSQVTYYVKQNRSNTDGNVTTKAGTSITLMEIK